MTEGDGASQRTAFRAWVRSHHPDAGGDPAEFTAGLAAWRRRLSVAGVRTPAVRTARARAAQDITVFRTQGGLWLMRRWWQRRHRPPRVR
jgi:hypothetical protein